MENLQAVTTIIVIKKNDWSIYAVSLAPRSDIKVCNILPHFCQDSKFKLVCCIAGAARNRGIYSTGARDEVTEDTVTVFI